MTQDAKTAINSTHSSKRKEQFNAARSVRGLQKRVTELERIVSSLLAERQIGVNSVALDLIPTEPRKKRGPVPVHQGFLLHTRDQIIMMIEAYWPEIEPLCSPTPNKQMLKKVLIAIRDKPRGRFEIPAAKLLENAEELLKFLASNRFRSDPRQIANAFAGVPKVSTWRSLKLCQANQSNLPIGDRAIRSYILSSPWCK